MSQRTASSRLLELALPGAWIAQHRRIWQINLLTARELSRFSRDRGLPDFDEQGIKYLWQRGLLKADLVESRRKFNRVGLVDQGTNRYGQHIYSDERQLRQPAKGWGKPVKSAWTLRSDVELLFHPFRYYVLYHLNRMLGLNINRMQMFNQEAYHRVLDITLSMFNRSTGFEQFITSIQRWNDIASLVIVTEPSMYVRIFHTIKYSPSDVDALDTGAEEISQHISRYWPDIDALYHRIGKERIEEIHQELCVDTQTLDSNRWIHTLLCLGMPAMRLELEGHLGGALLVRTMAEMLRRAAEKAFDMTLREEDEKGFGWMPEGVKEKIYGSNRLLDDQRAADVYTRRYGLNFGIRVHCYAEGDTEYGALNSFFKAMGVTVTNLHGLIKEGKSKTGKPIGATFFRDSLRSDIKNHVYSLVVIDADVRDNVRVLERAAADDELFGAFFLSDPDFEFANFEVEELEEVLWRMAGNENPSQEDRDYLHSYVKDATKSSEFFKGVERATQALTQLIQLDKGEKWGEELMKFAWEHQLKQGGKRQVVEAIELALHWARTTSLERYEVGRQRYQVNPATGKIIERSHAEPQVAGL